MAGEFKKLQAQTFNKSTEFESAEEKLWKKYKSPAGAAGASALSFSYPVTAVNFSKTAGSDFAVTVGTRVCIYDGKTTQLKRSLARFKDIAYAASFRYDGRLLAAGCKTSEVYVFDPVKGSLVRMLKGHTLPVQSTCWANSGSFLLTSSDDKSSKFWDISTEELVCTFNGHSDQVRSSFIYPSTTVLGEQIWGTGSYDHTVKLWDSRLAATKRCIMTLQHDGPIEAILAQPGDQPRVLAAAGNVIKTFDIVGGGRVLKEFSDHQKTITTMFMDGTGTRILSGSLDGLIKVSDAATYDCVANIAIGTGQGILSAGISANNSLLVVGCVSGQVVVRKRGGKEAKEEQEVDEFADVKTDSVPRGGTKRYFMRGGNVGPSPDDYKVESKKRVRLTAYDKHLKKFNYKLALDEVLKSRQPPIVVALFEELQQRNGLEPALIARDDASLEPILSFLVKFVTNPRFAKTLLGVCEVVLQLYGGDLGQSVLLDEMLSKLRIQLREELHLQKDLMQVSGTLDMILSA